MAVQLHKAMNSFNNWNNRWSDQRMAELYPERTESDVVREREREQYRLVRLVQRMNPKQHQVLLKFDKRHTTAAAA